MQDRFKFRAFNKELRKMYEVDTICPYKDNHTKGGEVFLKGIQYNSFYFPEEAEVMQCTGCKDKNGKLIYEGDVVYKKGSKNWKNEKLLSKVIWSSDSAAFMISDENGLHQMPMNSNNIEILGNIYENPEFIKEIEE